MVSRINNSQYLKLNLPLNNHTKDVSNNGNDGIPTDLTYSTNQFGKGCGSFNGSSTKIELGNPEDLQMTTQTICAWVKTTSTNKYI